jgi:hypothetical protein
MRARACALLAALALVASLASGTPGARVELPAGGSLELVTRDTPWAEGDRLPPERIEEGQHLGLRTPTWLGTVAVDGGWSDFREQRIPAGHYALCYALQPRRKEHAGLDAIRDFATLVAASGRASAPCDGDWLAGSRAVTGTGHPAVLALVPGERIGSQTGLEPNWVITPLDVAGEAIGFVVVGHAPPADGL